MNTINNTSPNYFLIGGITLIIIFIIILYLNTRPIDGILSEWSEWNECSDGISKRTRICTPPKNGGKPCDGETEETRPCKIIYSEWSKCDKPCGIGKQIRTCKIENPDGSFQECENEERECNNFDCVIRITAKGKTGTELLTFLDTDFNQIHQQRLKTTYTQFDVKKDNTLYIVFENPTIRNEITFSIFDMQGNFDFDIKQLQFHMFKDINKISKPNDPVLQQSLQEFYNNKILESSLGNKGFFSILPKK